MDCCLDRSLTREAEVQPALSPRPERTRRAQSPVAHFAQSELETVEVEAYFQLQARNRELRHQIGWDCKREVQGISAQVDEWLARLRYALNEHTSLRAELKALQDLPQHQRPGSPARFAAAATGTEREAAEHQKVQDESVMAEIQNATQQSIELISQYDAKVKTLESEIVVARRRQQAAEMEMRLPPSLRSISPPRTGTLRQASPPGRDGEELTRQQAELQMTEQECGRLAREVQEVTASRKSQEERVKQELQLAQEVQREEVEHFRRLVQEKRNGGAVRVSGSTQVPTAGALLEAEMEQLRDHLAQTQRKAEQERNAADQSAEDLRREIQQLNQDLAAKRAEKERTTTDAEEAKKNSSVPPVGDWGRTPESEREHGEALLKEIARTRSRIASADVKVKQLEEEAAEIGQRASKVMLAVPDMPGSADPGVAKKTTELQEIVGERQRRLATARRAEQGLQEELQSVGEAHEAARVEAAVMEQKLKLLKNRSPKFT